MSIDDELDREKNRLITVAEAVGLLAKQKNISTVKTARWLIHRGIGDKLQEVYLDRFGRIVSAEHRIKGESLPAHAILSAMGYGSWLSRLFAWAVAGNSIRELQKGYPKDCGWLRADFYRFVEENTTEPLIPETLSLNDARVKPAEIVVNRFVGPSSDDEYISAMDAILAIANKSHWGNHAAAIALMWFWKSDTEIVALPAYWWSYEHGFKAISKSSIEMYLRDAFAASAVFAKDRFDSRIANPEKFITSNFMAGLYFSRPHFKQAIEGIISGKLPSSIHISVMETADELLMQKVRLAALEVELRSLRDENARLKSSAEIEMPLTESEKERNRLLKTIGSLALLIAEKSSRYKRGDKPNASQIAAAVAESLDAIPDSNPHGLGDSNVRDSISRGLKLLQN